MTFEFFDVISRPAFIGPVTERLIGSFQELGCFLGENRSNLGIVFGRLFCFFHNFFNVFDADRLRYGLLL